MEKHRQRHRAGLHPAQVAGLAISAALLASAAQAQSLVSLPGTDAGAGWRLCAALGDGAARLACFDRWAGQQTPPSPTSPAILPAATTSLPASPSPNLEAGATVVSAGAPAPPPSVLNAHKSGCYDPQAGMLARFWELEAATDCGTFGIRSYRPLSLSWVSSNSVNTAPNSPSPGHAAPYQPYLRYETRIQLSVRTKLARGLLTRSEERQRDSLWFGYTQQSDWQLLNGALSRPFRNTDHEPELIYIYPAVAELGRGWHLRYGGIVVSHQSNGQSLPQSRSWNRVSLMAGMEKAGGFWLQGRLWQRIPEKARDDDNPGISDYVGRAEVAGFWSLNQRNTLGVTVRHSLRRDARGSARLEWLRALGPPATSALRLHTQLFSGYGDNLLDYNRRRVVLSIGLSLVEF